ncbi:MAG: hypothetical protein K1X94_28490 [Sandaracinaceae bacterium]|nr:hypothetical protein [Sandaracinaceae bacterium]
MRTSSWLLAVVVVLLGGASSARVLAQARDLASPWGAQAVPPSSSASIDDELGPDDAAADEAADVRGADELGPPPSGDEVVPPPPGSYGDDGMGPVRVAEPGDLPPESAATGATGSAGPPAAVGWVPAEPGSSLQLRSSISTRLRALDADLQVLAARGGGNIVDGILAIAMGATSVGIGIFMDVSGSSPSPSITPYLYVYGGSGIVRGILDFAFLRNPSTVAITYAHMPMGDLAEVRTRLRFGERELESLAQTAEISRILDGALSIGTGLAVVPVYLGPTNFTFSNAFDYFVLIGAAVSATTGVITLFSANEAERRWSAYRELRERLLATEQGAADEREIEAAAEQLEAFETAPASAEFHPVVAASQGGVFAGATGTF